MATRGRQSEADRLLEQLRAIAAEIAKVPTQLVGEDPADKGSQRARKKAHSAISGVVEELSRIAAELDHVKDPVSVFDPSDPRMVGKFVGVALVAQERAKLGAVAPFHGSGVYAIYYTGGFEPYGPLVGTETPIYVGKADPGEGGAKTPRQQGTKLHGRLREHARSIGKATTTLSLDDFECRYLVVQSGWQEAAESYLISLFQPVWNDETGICWGLGKHGDDPGTRKNLRSPWDTMHPGRDWAHRDPNMQDARSTEQIKAALSAHFEAVPVFKNVDAVLHRFFEALKQ